MAEALEEKLGVLALAKSAKRGWSNEWKAFEARLKKFPDGSYINPEIPGIDLFIARRRS